MIFRIVEPNPVKRRRGTVGNRDRLLSAIGQLLRDDPAKAMMPAIAERADVSVATAYRHFPTLGEAHAAYIHEVLLGFLSRSQKSELEGLKYFEFLTNHWVALLDELGPAMILNSPKKGILSRIRIEEKISCVVRDAWERPIREVLHELGVHDRHFELALLVHSALFNPREIADLLESDIGTSHEEAIQALIDVYYSALQGLTPSTA